MQLISIHTDIQPTLDIIWLATATVFFMQAGFTMLESGMVRAKNSYNVALKNVSDLCAAIVTFWVLGFAIMFGSSSAGWFGTDGFFGEGMSSSKHLLFFAFQATFVGTAATIVAGAVAERPTPHSCDRANGSDDNNFNSHRT